MRGITQTDNTILLENKPYLTKSEVSVLVQKQSKNLDKKISQLLKIGYLISLKKGLYTTKGYVDKQIPQLREFVANIQYYPSYISLEYVLQKEGLIPEAVYTYTSITLKPTQTFTNTLGTFIYRSIKQPLFTGYEQVRYDDQYQIKIASKMKALFDLLYLKPLPNTVSGKQQVLEDLRIRFDAITPADTKEFNSYVSLINSPKMRQVSTIIAKLSL